MITRQTPLLATDRDQISALSKVIQRVLTLRAADADGAWAQLELAPQSRQAAWAQLVAELARFRHCCPALAALPAPTAAPHTGSGGSGGGGVFHADTHSLHSAALSLRAPTPGLPASSAPHARALYPGLPDRPPRFGGGDGE